ncbi:MAG TPA: tRNA (N6-threonylcarbamoyladenosine(37)-N6)-methyltransferase TrmO [Ghiorsea sp.]|nr:tRNA (N6-threonylcarbamoyladenosine(37)-N6)-methyltransferase TrmO [Ghiorsea sp.]HIP08079.1 tRNA (N6-threonylcarbamoyladenosine(37)-N6)-methyltransferase TrmO [Mariprofundaceae bacterium]
MGQDWRNPQHTKHEKTYAADKLQGEMESVQLQPIGVVSSPYKERFATPRQPAYAVGNKPASITLHTGFNYEQALQDLDTFSHIWVIYWMHLNQGWNPLVKPPRDKENKHGVFSTRAPHRPNSMGLSVVPLLGIQGRVLNIGNHDMLDGTPVLDIKPYIPESDCMTQANAGWIDKL